MYDNTQRTKYPEGRKENNKQALFSVPNPFAFSPWSIYMLPVATPTPGRSLFGDLLRGDCGAEQLGVPPNELLSDETRTSTAESLSGISNLKNKPRRG